MKKYTTPMIERVTKIAQDYGLPDPRGRALYLVNRAYNDGLNLRDFVQFPKLVAERMKKAKPETAARWRKHVDNGGSLKALKYSREEYSAVKKKSKERVKARRQEEQ